MLKLVNRFIQTLINELSLNLNLNYNNLTMEKNFKSWCVVKEQINNRQRPVFKEREIWWCYTGANVGVEVDGKGSRFTRPILVIRKFNRNSFYGLPLSTKIQKDNDFNYIFEFNNRYQSLNLTQMRLIDSKRLQRSMGEVSEEKFKTIKKALLGLFE